MRSAPAISTRDGAGSAEEVLEKSILPLIPVNRLGEPDEIARAVVFLAADEAGAITGSTLSIKRRAIYGVIVVFVIARSTSRRSNPVGVMSNRWAASRSLSSGAHSCDPLARNDGSNDLTYRHAESD